MRSSFHTCLILTGCLVLAACTKGQPDFQVINEDRIPQPTFLGATTKSIITASSTTDFLINGECDPKISDLKATALNPSVSASSLREMTNSGLTITCPSNGKFQFELKSFSGLGISPTEGMVYEIDVQGITSAGLSRASKIRITYSTLVGGEGHKQITSGSTRNARGGPFSANMRIVFKGNDYKLGVPSNVQTSAEDAFKKTDGQSSPSFSANIGIKVNN